MNALELVQQIFHRPFLAELRALLRSHAEGFQDLNDVLSELSPEEWRFLVEAGEALRCETCLGVDCTCPDDEEIQT